MDKLMTPKELAERYNMTQESLANWRLAGKGPAWIRLGSGKRPRVMYRMTDVLTWEKQNEQRAI